MISPMDWLKSLFDVVFPFFENLSVLRVILGNILVFSLPGFAWSLVFFRGKPLSILERLALSFGLFIALVTLSILAAHTIFGVDITGLNAAIIIVIITVIPLAIYCPSTYLMKFPKKEILKSKE